MLVGNVVKKWNNVLLVVFRVVVGVVFFEHGAQKVFGWFGGSVMEITSLFGVAGVVELVAGAALVLGVFVRLTALLGAIEMVVAYLMVHLPQGLDPLQNGGELAVLYFVAFLVLLVNGAGLWSLEKKVLRKENF